jgi:hypothetical protein
VFEASWLDLIRAALWQASALPKKSQAPAMRMKLARHSKLIPHNQIVGIDLPTVGAEYERLIYGSIPALHGDVVTAIFAMWCCTRYLRLPASSF